MICEPPSVDLLRSTPAPGRDGYSSELTRLIMGNSALPTRGSPLTVQPIYCTTNTVSGFHSLLQSTVRTSTLSGAQLRRQSV
jgi:hypothetical protein